MKDCGKHKYVEVVNTLEINSPLKCIDFAIFERKKIKYKNLEFKVHRMLNCYFLSLLNMFFTEGEDQKILMDYKGLWYLELGHVFPKIL